MSTRPITNRGSPEKLYDQENVGMKSGDADEPQAERAPLIIPADEQGILKPGDYQVHVNIIEVKDIIPLDLNGLADPLVSVEILKEKRYTKIKAGTLNASFNELFTFNFDGLEREDLSTMSIKITVYDADTYECTSNHGCFFRDSLYMK
jgi:hypothetical protein